MGASEMDVTPTVLRSNAQGSLAEVIKANLTGFVSTLRLSHYERDELFERDHAADAGLATLDRVVKRATNRLGRLKHRRQDTSVRVNIRLASNAADSRSRMISNANSFLNSRSQFATVIGRIMKVLGRRSTTVRFFCARLLCSHTWRPATG